MQNRSCKGCQHHNTCEEVYRCLGHSNAPPVTANVLVAFVLPMVTFVVTLGVSRGMWGSLAPAKIMALLSFLVALAATVLVAAAGAWWMRTTDNELQEMRRNG
jgi:hypothetical protein